MINKLPKVLSGIDIIDYDIDSILINNKTDWFIDRNISFLYRVIEKEFNSNISASLSILWFSRNYNIDNAFCRYIRYTHVIDGYGYPMFIGIRFSNESEKFRFLLTWM